MTSVLHVCVVVTGREDWTAKRDDLAARATAMQIGSVAFFIKPFNDEEFLAAIRLALSGA